MKFSTVALLALVQGIVAAPSLLGQLKHGQVTDEDITLSIKVSQVPLKKENFHQKALDVCWLICASEEIECPENWFSKQEGECWTCCRKVD